MMSRTRVLGPVAAAILACSACLAHAQTVGDPQSYWYFKDLPACSAPLTGGLVRVIDSSTFRVGSIMAGNGQHKCVAVCDGKVWRVSFCKDRNNPASVPAPRSQ